MAASTRTSAPRATLEGFELEVFDSDGFRHRVYRAGSGPAVLVLAELPGLTPQVLGFAQRLASQGYTAVVPHLFGAEGMDPMARGKLGGFAYTLGVTVKACVSREFSAFVLGRASPIVRWLRALAASEHARCGGPGVGVVGMCFTGGFALAMAADPRVLAPVLSQPSLPFPISKRHRASVDCAPQDLDLVAQRCASEGLQVLGLRFKGDPYVPSARFRFLKEALGEGFVAVELAPESRHPQGPLPRAHSVLTGDLIDEPGEPTRDALERVLTLLRDKLLTPVA